MKRFLLFVYDGECPNGGWDDFKGSFDTLREAKTAAHTSTEHTLWRDLYQIVDTVAGGVLSGALHSLTEDT